MAHNVDTTSTRYHAWQPWEIDILKTHDAGKSWGPIFEKLSHRTRQAIKFKWRVDVDPDREKRPRPQARPWTEWDDVLLFVVVAQFGHVRKQEKWDRAAAFVGRRPEAARSRFYALSKQPRFVRLWKTIQNDDFLRTGWIDTDV